MLTATQTTRSVDLTSPMPTRPANNIAKELLSELTALGYSLNDIIKATGLSMRTLKRVMKDDHHTLFHAGFHRLLAFYCFCTVAPQTN